MPPDDSLLDLAENELRRRLSSEEEAKEIPGGQLATLYTNLQKAEKEPEETDTGPQKSVLDIVRDTDLPQNRKREIITKEIARLRGEIKQLEAELDE